jgi:holo-[acyl-carrier protein] synthase
VNVVSVGIDAVEVPRFRGVLERRPRIAERLFTEEERAYALRFRDPSERLAARFAAKEAAMKAMGVGISAFAFREVSVGRQPSGAPTLRVEGAARRRAEAAGIDAWLVSLTHTSSIAEAIVVGLAR